MKIVAIGDIHGRDSWKKIISAHSNADKIIFVGDYFDTLDKITPLEQIQNFKEIVEFKKDSDKAVILLIGNHDHHYFSDVGHSGITGYQAGAAPAISQVLEENRRLLQMAYRYQNYLFTHAGVTKTFLKDNGWEDELIDEYINDLWQYKPRSFIFHGISPTGDDICQTPIWVRPRSLMKDSKDLGLIQIVGHTQMDCIDIKGKSTGSRYFFIDTLGTSKEYLIIENEAFYVNKGY
jgi:predicted MPP superfamily phosphohydrolase